MDVRGFIQPHGLKTTYARAGLSLSTSIPRLLKIIRLRDLKNDQGWLIEGKRGNVSEYKTHWGDS